MAYPVGSSETCRTAHPAEKICSGKALQILKITGIVLAILAAVAASILFAVFSPPVAAFHTIPPYYLYASPYFFPFF